MAKSEPWGGMRRRTLLRGAALGPLAGLAAGCGDLAKTAGIGDYVRIAVSWSATELAAFRRVLDRGRVDDYELIPLGDDIGAALGATTTGRPDVVALPQPGHVAGNQKELAPLPAGVWHDEYDRILPGERFALPFKLAHASVVWYRKQFFAEHNLDPPATWQEWLELNESIIEIGGVAPLALGGADGWVLAQFFENALLRTHPKAYDELVSRREPRSWKSNEVRDAFEMVAGMWGRDGALSGGADRALALQFPDAVLEVFRYGRAAMVPAPDFAESVIRRFAGTPEDAETFTFPARVDGAPLAISADLLVLPQPPSEAAQRLIRYLARPEAPLPWIRETGGFIAANPRTDLRYYSPTLRRLAQELRDEEIRFGLADRLGRVGGSEGLLGVLQRLLRRIADGTGPADAADAACQEMSDVEQAR